MIRVAYNIYDRMKIRTMCWSETVDGIRGNNPGIPVYTKILYKYNVFIPWSTFWKCYGFLFLQLNGDYYRAEPTGTVFNWFSLNDSQPIRKIGSNLESHVANGVVLEHRIWENIAVLAIQSTVRYSSEFTTICVCYLFSYRLKRSHRAHMIWYLACELCVCVCAVFVLECSKLGGCASTTQPTNVDDRKCLHNRECVFSQPSACCTMNYY